uniref:Serine and arginine rich splicing factor 4 n=1 Tax=Nothobranchius furzeri TaxID=105023 RepID=A0A8C6P5X7_NOTFU
MGLGADVGSALIGGYGRWGGRDRYGPPVRTDYRLIVENLSSRCSWQDLKDYMRQAGEVTYADTHKGRRNEGVIEFRQYSDMKRALEKLDGTEVNGRKIRLVEDRPGARRQRSYSRSRSRLETRVAMMACLSFGSSGNVTPATPIYYRTTGPRGNGKNECKSTGLTRFSNPARFVPWISHMMSMKLGGGVV